MKISYNWLKNYLNIDLDVSEVAKYLTDTGLEVGGLETFESLKGGLKGVVVGEVLTCEPHPDADRLRCTTVNVGQDEPLPIVCGAPNVAAGQKVAVATVGTTLYAEDGAPFEIKKAKIRGQLSMGMICAEDELGLGESHDGIMVLDEDVKVGTPASEYFDIYTDQIIEIDITPNRSDALSHYGVARDLAAALHRSNVSCELNMPAIEKIPLVSKLDVDVSVSDEEGAPRYAGTVIKNLKIKPSPEWLQNALKSIGLAPINNVVDVTNYVLHELGQPLHAFDLEVVQGTVNVRRAKQGEPFTTLDGERRELDKEDLLIANAKDGMCLAGVFGGEVSGVSEQTTSIFLESACFHPVIIRAMARRHGLNTDASFRFERGTDVNGVLPALFRAANLIVELAGGVIEGGAIDLYHNPIPAQTIKIKWSYINTLIGKTIPAAEVLEILHDLDFKVLSNVDDLLELEVPTYRVEVTRPADVVEEVLRIYGYNNIEIPDHLHAAIEVDVADPARILKQQMGVELAALGYSEIMTNSLEAEAYYEDREDAFKGRLVHVLNPLSKELNIMRPSALFGGLETIRFNANRQHKRLQFFEFGYTYLKTEAGYQEDPFLAMFISGAHSDETWKQSEAPADFYQLKGVVEHVLRKAGLNVKSLKYKVDKTAQGDFELVISLGKSLIAQVISIGKKTLSKVGMDQPVFAAVVHWAMLTKNLKAKTKFKALPKYPSVRRDLALLLDKHVSYQEVEKVVRQYSPNTLQDVNLFDVYNGKNLPAGKKSYAIGITFRDEESTLTDKKIDKAMDKVMFGLKKELTAELR